MGSTLQSRFEANYGPEVPGLISRRVSLPYFIKRGSLAAWSATASCFLGREQDVRDMRIGILSETFRVFQQRMRDSRGYRALHGPHGKRLELDLPGEPVRIQAEWDRSARLLAETCQNMGIPLLIRFTPMPTDLSHAKGFSPIEDWSQDLRRSYRNVIIGHPTLLWYDPKLCWDHIHLNAPGAAVYMALLANDVRAILENANASNRK
jgi:hypothetical protein